MSKLVRFLLNVVTVILGFFAGMFSMALFTALHSHWSTIFQITLVTAVPYALFALVLFADGKNRRNNSVCFLIALLWGGGITA